MRVGSFRFEGGGVRAGGTGALGIACYVLVVLCLIAAVPGFAQVALVVALSLCVGGVLVVAVAAAGRGGGGA